MRSEICLLREQAPMSKNRDAEAPTQSGDRSYEALDTMAIAAFDVDARIFRTVWHSLTRPIEVMWAGCKADFSRYLSPVRVFLALFSLQVVIGSLVDFPTALTLEALTDGMPDDRIADWYQGQSPDEIDRSFAPIMSLLNWPLMLLSSLPYLIALKLMRWRLKFWAHVMAYLVATNTSSLVQTLVLPLAKIDNSLVLLAMPVSLIVFVVQLARIMSRFYSRSAWELTWRTTVMVLLLPITVLMLMISNFGVAGWLLHEFHGLSLLELYIPQTQ